MGDEYPATLCEGELIRSSDKKNGNVKIGLRTAFEPYHISPCSFSLRLWAHAPTIIFKGPFGSPSSQHYSMNPSLQRHCSLPDCSKKCSLALSSKTGQRFVRECNTVLLKVFKSRIQMNEFEARAGLGFRQGLEDLTSSLVTEVGERVSVRSPLQTLLVPS